MVEDADMDVVCYTNNYSNGVFLDSDGHIRLSERRPKLCDLYLSCLARVAVHTLGGFPLSCAPD